MTVPFIMMTIACAILILTEILQHRRNKRLTEKLKEINEKGWRKAHGFGRLVSTRRRFIVIEKAGDNTTLNRTVEKYKEEGYEYDSQNSTDRLLVFAKYEEIKED